MFSEYKKWRELSQSLVVINLEASKSEYNMNGAGSVEGQASNIPECWDGASLGGVLEWEGCSQGHVNLSYS